MTERVLAVVLTFNARASLRECLAAIRAQTRPVDAILVVDNASSEPVDDLVAAVPNTTLLRLPENRGPAGGYAEGLGVFVQSEATRAWVMDDDCAPASGALAAQLEVAPRAPLVLASMIDRESGEVADTQGWCAVLLGREVVETVGVPDATLFWWNEDTEYLQWRIPRAGYRVERCADAKVSVLRTRSDAAKPAWKYYYETRNQVYYRLVTQRPRSGSRPPRYLSRRVRYGRATRSVAKLAVRSLLREREQRGRKLAMVCRGTIDGVRGRLGRTVPVDAPDRPLAREPTR